MKYTLKGRVGRLRWVAALSFFGKLVIWGVKMNARNRHWGGRGLGSYFLICIPTPPSTREEGFLSLFSLDQKCYGIGAWWEHLICKANFIVMRTSWAKVTFRSWRFPPFPIFLCLPPECLSPKMCGFLSVQRFLLFFVFPRTSILYKMYGFLPHGPWPPPFLWSYLAVYLS